MEKVWKVFDRVGITCSFQTPSTQFKIKKTDNQLSGGVELYLTVLSINNIRKKISTVLINRRSLLSKYLVLSKYPRKAPIAVADRCEC